MIVNTTVAAGAPPYTQFETQKTNLSRLVPIFSEPVASSIILSSDLERCHSSTQAMINNTHVVIFKGKQPGAIAPGIWITRFQSDSTWSPPQPLVQAESLSTTCFSPVLCQQKDGTVLLFYRVGPTPDKLTTHVKITTDGEKFVDADYLLREGIIGPTKIQALQTPDGLLFGSSSEKGSWTFDKDNKGVTGCHVELLQTDGTWIRSDNLLMPEGYNQDNGGAIEPTLFKYGINGNSIGMLCRNRYKVISEGQRGGYALFSLSEDNGRTWSRLQDSTLRNPDTSLVVLDLGKGKLIVFYNDSQNERHRLSFAISSNGGVNWSEPCVLIEKEGEFPSAILLPNGKISVAYADKKGQLNHITIDPALIEINGKPW